MAMKLISSFFLIASLEGRAESGRGMRKDITKTEEFLDRTLSHETSSFALDLRLRKATKNMFKVCRIPNGKQSQEYCMQ